MIARKIQFVVPSCLVCVIVLIVNEISVFSVWVRVRNFISIDSIKSDQHRTEQSQSFTHMSYEMTYQNKLNTIFVHQIFVCVFLYNWACV